MKPVSPWRWIPTLYFAQGLPYVVVMTLSVVMYKNLGVSNTLITLYTSWLYLPWVIKPLWSPLVELLGAKRRWIVGLQFAIGVAFALVALTLPAPKFLQLSLAMFWLMAFASATHDIAADGFYLLALPQRAQAAFVGVRSTFYRLSMLGGQGGLVYLAGWLAERHGSVVLAWSWVFGLLAALFAAAALAHLWLLPRPVADLPAPRRSGGAAVFWRDFFAVFAAFFRRRDIGRILAFLLLYRFAEAQLLKLVTPFLLDARADGGLGLSTQDVGIAYGTVGVAALTLGGLLGGWVISRGGLKRLLWPLMICMHAPNVLFVLLALWQPQSLLIVSAALAVEQFGYGFGFTAYMVFMLMVASSGDEAGAEAGAHKRAGNGVSASLNDTPQTARQTAAPTVQQTAHQTGHETGHRKGHQTGHPTGHPTTPQTADPIEHPTAHQTEHPVANQTAHYALCTGFMALGMMLPGMWAGWLQDRLGYADFFIWGCIATIPSFIAAALVRIDPLFGRRTEQPAG